MRHARTPRPIYILFAASTMANAQVKEIGPAPVSAAVARQQIRTLLKRVDPGNSQQTVKTLAGLTPWYRDLLDEELIAAWRRDDRANLPPVIDSLADPRVAAGVVEFSWRQQRQTTFNSAYAPILGRLMARYADSAKPFLDDLLGSTATGRQALDLSQAEAEAVCRILLDMPDIRTWRKSALQILPHYRRDAEDLLDKDLQGGDREKMYRATRWLADLQAVDSAFGAQRGIAATTPRLDPAVPAAANIPDGPMVCVAPPSGLVGWWPGDSNANDIAGGHNASALNAVNFVPGEVRNGFGFGTQGYIEIPQAPGLENQQFTWLAWVRPDGPGPNARSLIINQNIDGTHASVNLAWRPSDQRFTFHSGDSTTDLIVSEDTFPAGAFYLVAATYDGATFKLRVNGIHEGSLSASKTVPYSSYGWEIGAGALRSFPNNANTWNGVIDEVQAYNRALSAAEILSIFQAGSAGVCKDAAGGGVSTAGDPLSQLGPPRARPSEAAQAGVLLTPLDPATVDGASRSINGNTAALIDFVNRSSRPVDIYWINYQGDRVLYYAGLAAGANWLERTGLTHPWLVVVSGTGGTTAQDTGNRLAGFEAVTPNATGDQAKRDTAIITDAASAAGASQVAAPTGPGTMRPDGTYLPGNGVSQPKLLSRPGGETTEVANKLRASGYVYIDGVIQADGATRDLKVVSPMGYGLDEKAIEVVRQWRFQPCMKDGSAVPCPFSAGVGSGDYRPISPGTWHSGPMVFALEAGMMPPVVRDGTMPKPMSEGVNESVILDFTVDSSGSVKDIHSFSGSKSGSDLLSSYLAGWKFRPARKDGRSLEAAGRVLLFCGKGEDAVNRRFSPPPLPQSNPVPSTGAAQNAGAPGKMFKDLDEFRIYKAAVTDLGDKNRSKAIEDLNAWKQKYPDSDYQNLREDMYLQAYALGNGKPEGVSDAANQAAAQPGPGAMAPDAVYPVGNGVSAPSVLSKGEPEYTPVALKLRVVEGTVVLQFVVGPDGRAQDFDVLQSVGYGLDEKAIEAVGKWRFRPGMKDGKAVPVAMQYAAHFQAPEGPGADTWTSGPMAFAAEAGFVPPVVKDGTMPKPVSEFSNESAILEFTVDASGSVKNIHPLHGSRSASELLARYLVTWEFQPAVKGNQPVETTGRVRFVKGKGDEAALLRPRPGSNPPRPSLATETSAPPGDRTQTRTMVNPTDGQKYVWISPGDFTMGCSPGDTECAGDEKPPHAERVENGFWLGQTEVTQAAYLRVTGANPSNHKGDQFPVESLTWDHAANYCRAIGGRLPTEAEWEYAARADSTWARYGSLDDVAWHAGNSGGATHPVAMKQPNAFGLYDMLGNVWEYVAGSYPGSPDKILRGGSPFVDLRNTRASSRGRSAPSATAIGRGFRCAGEWPAAEKTPPVGGAGTAAPTAGAGTGPSDRVYRADGVDSVPAVLYKVQPEYTEVANKAKLQGTVLLHIQIDPSGRAVNIRVLHSLGLGLDEKAIECVKKWKFKPGFKNGVAVTVEAQVELNFRLL